MRRIRPTRRVVRSFRPSLLELEARVVLSFLAGRAYPAGSESVAVAVGDVNGDGWPALVVANDGSNDVSILLNDGAWAGPRPGPGDAAPHGGDFPGRGAAVPMRPAAPSGRRGAGTAGRGRFSGPPAGYPRRSGRRSCARAAAAGERCPGGAPTGLAPVGPGFVPSGLAPVEAGFIIRRLRSRGLGPHRARPGGARVRPPEGRRSPTASPPGLPRWNVGSCHMNPRSTGASPVGTNFNGPHRWGRTRAPPGQARWGPRLPRQRPPGDEPGFHRGEPGGGPARAHRPSGGRTRAPPGRARWGPRPGAPASFPLQLPKHLVGIQHLLRRLDQLVVVVTRQPL